MNIQLLLCTFWHGLDFQKLPYSMNSFYLKHMSVISDMPSVMSNNLTGRAKLSDVTQSMIKSLSFSDNWIFCLLCNPLGSCAFMPPPKSEGQQMFAFTSLVWGWAGASLPRGHILEVSFWTHYPDLEELESCWLFTPLSPRKSSVVNASL